MSFIDHHGLKENKAVSVTSAGSAKTTGKLPLLNEMLAEVGFAVQAALKLSRCTVTDGGDSNYMLKEIRGSKNHDCSREYHTAVLDSSRTRQQILAPLCRPRRISFPLLNKVLNLRSHTSHPSRSMSKRIVLRASSDSIDGIRVTGANSRNLAVGSHSVLEFGCSWIAKPGFHMSLAPTSADIKRRVVFVSQTNVQPWTVTCWYLRGNTRLARAMRPTALPVGTVNRSSVRKESREDEERSEDPHVWQW